MDGQSAERSARIREAIEAMVRAMRLHRRVVERRIEGLGVHHSQHRMLMLLSRMDGSDSQKDIAEALDVSPACVARTLKQLSAAGLIEKTEGGDGRCNGVRVRPEGRRLVDDSLEVFRQIDGGMFDGISGAELQTLNRLLRRVWQNLAAMQERGTKDAPDGKGA